MAEATKRVLLKQAAERVGRHELAVRLGSPVSLIEAWMQGMATMPDRKFLQLVDLLDELGDQPPRK
jgi:hypothetical protein